MGEHLLLSLTAETLSFLAKPKLFSSRVRARAVVARLVAVLLAGCFGNEGLGTDIHLQPHGPAAAFRDRLPGIDHFPQVADFTFIWFLGHGSLLKSTIQSSTNDGKNAIRRR